MGKTVEQQIESAVRDVADPVVRALHSVAENLRDKLDAYEQAVIRHQEAQSLPPQHVARMDELYQQYTRALFDENAHGAAVVQKERRVAQKALERAQKEEQRARKAVEAATFPQAEEALEAQLRARKAHDEVTQTLAGIGVFLGFGGFPSGGLIGTIQTELQQARAAVDQQVNRAPNIFDEEERLRVTEKVYPGSIAERRRQQRQDRAAFEPILARF